MIDFICGENNIVADELFIELRKFIRGKAPLKPTPMMPDGSSSSQDDLWIDSFLDGMGKNKNDPQVIANWDDFFPEQPREQPMGQPRGQPRGQPPIAPPSEQPRTQLSEQPNEQPPRKQLTKWQFAQYMDSLKPQKPPQPPLKQPSERVREEHMRILSTPQRLYHQDQQMVPQQQMMQQMIPQQQMMQQQLQQQQMQLMQQQLQQQLQQQMMQQQQMHQLEMAKINLELARLKTQHEQVLSTNVLIKHNVDLVTHVLGNKGSSNSFAPPSSANAKTPVMSMWINADSGQSARLFAARDEMRKNGERTDGRSVAIKAFGDIGDRDYKYENGRWQYQLPVSQP
jgi:hypothetical protein